MSEPLKFEPLSVDLLKRIREEAFQLLDEVGIFMELEEAYDFMGKYGCKAEVKERIVRIPVKVILKALETAPKHIKLYDRNGKLSAEIGGDNVNFDPGSAAIHLLDFETGVIRKPALSDLKDLAALASNLQNFTMQSTAIVPGDVPEEISDSVRLYAALKYCSKPVVTGTFKRESFNVMYEMLKTVRGGAKELAEMPLAIFDCCPSPPLRWSELTAAAVMDCARAGIPSEFVSMPLMGATAPVTYVGALVQHTAEDLSGVVLAQAAKEGAPVIYGGSPSVFDMRQGTTPMGAIETMLFDTAYAQIGKSFGLPIHAYMGLSDSRNVDYQGGLETGMGAIMAAAAGINVVSGAGMMDFESCQSFEKLVLDNEICGMALHMRKGIRVFSDNLGYDTIKTHFREADFIKSPETKKLYRSQQYFPSNVIERTAGGMNSGDSAYSRAHLRVMELLEKGPEVINTALGEKLKEIISAEAMKYGMKSISI